MKVKGGRFGSSESRQCERRFGKPNRGWRSVYVNDFSRKREEHEDMGCLGWRKILGGEWFRGKVTEMESGQAGKLERVSVFSEGEKEKRRCFIYLIDKSCICSAGSMLENSLAVGPKISALLFMMVNLECCIFKILELTNFRNFDVFAEREQLFGHITLSRKGDSKSFDYNENALDSTGFKSGNGVTKENQNRESCDLKVNERDAVQLPYLRNDRDDLDVPKLDCSKDVDDSITHKGYQVTDFVAKLENDSQFYMDKSVMECELPEFLVCYKESDNHAIKDICIDDGVPSKDKVLFESSANEKAGCTFVFLEKDQNKQLIKEQADIHIPDKLKSSVNSEKHPVNLCELRDLMQRDDADNLNGNDVSKEKFFPGNVLSLGELEIDKSHSIYTSKEGIAAEQQTFQITSEITNPVNTSLVSAVEESNKRSEEALPSTASVSVDEELNNSILGNEFSYDSMVENGSITFDFDSLAPVAIANDEHPQNGDSKCAETQNKSLVNDDTLDTRVISSQAQEDLAPLNATCASSQVQHVVAKEECPQNGVPGSFGTSDTSMADGTSGTEAVSGQIQHGIAREECPQTVVCGCCETQNMAIVEDLISGSQPVSSRFQYGLGESSFSASSGPLPSHINFSGPIPYSGNISHRSDSSTTSTRSFAFPVCHAFVIHEIRGFKSEYAISIVVMQYRLWWLT
ncbi:hypothetical protein FNV43_RR26360 [Rhamnella rubrinervis]|uniref:Uncharacterized protein n=1 Tax=Rhamnella rubrinervis TaxID=2594499 RepID=A0A8K0DP55_9ROSA|nr:hypothetical protein FNV43_RR26360 [Rhamnella rubrinervis]